jgi:hypothetical protein
MVMEGRRISRKQPLNDTIELMSVHKRPNGIIWFICEKKLAVRWYDKLMIFEVPSLKKLSTFPYNGYRSIGDGIFPCEVIWPYVYDLRVGTFPYRQPPPIPINPVSTDSEVIIIRPSKVYLFDTASLMVSRYSLMKIPLRNEPSKSKQEDTVVFSFLNRQKSLGMKLGSKMELVDYHDDGRILLFSDRASYIAVNVITHDIYSESP